MILSTKSQSIADFSASVTDVSHVGLNDSCGQMIPIINAWDKKADIPSVWHRTDRRQTILHAVAVPMWDSNGTRGNVYAVQIFNNDWA